MRTPPIPLLWAKLEPPRLPPGAVDRAGLVERLARPGAALTAVVAPAGYGKTTLAAQVAAALDGDVAWVSLEPADDEPVRLLTYVAAALGHAGVAGVDAAYDLLASGIDAVADTSLLLRSAVEGHGDPVVLVLDDVQAIGDPVVEATIGEWLRHPLANLRILAASRSDLPLPVGRLRGRGLLSEARVDDLAFDRDETAALLAGAFGLADLTDDQLTALGRRTEGWPVGLYLAGLTLRDDPHMADGLARFTGDTRHLDEYLGAEATDGLTDDDRAFLLATSILTTLEPSLCDAVTEGAGSLRILRRLATDNVFTETLDDGATLFRYHPLFREHLRSSLGENHPEQVCGLHARASAWYEANGDADPAIDHAIAADDRERAERLVIDRFLIYANAGHFATIAGWVDRLGRREELRAETALAMAWLALNRRLHDDVDEWLAVAAANATNPAERATVELQTPSVLLHRARHRGDVGAMVARAEQALAAERTAGLELASPEVDALRFGEEGRSAAFSSSASAAYWAGQPDDARDRALEALRLLPDRRLSLEQVFCYQYLAMVAADAGEHEEALAHADQALSLVGPGQENTHLPALAHLARSLALAGLGRPADAADALAAARRVAAYRSEPLNDAAIELQQARLHHAAGDQDGARGAVRSARAIVADLPDPRFDDRIRAAENATRFVAPDAEALPIGARELTDRERAVLALLPHELSRRELARQLHVSENTIKTHLTSIRHKLGVAGRQSIVVRAAELGLVESAVDVAIDTPVDTPLEG